MTRTTAVVTVLVLALALPHPARAQNPTPALEVLDVPFLAQGEDLCGGAAAAMVLRFWGGRASPEDFAPLVDQVGGGIRGDTLAAALRDRGWTAISLRGSESTARAQLAHGRPFVILVEDRPGRYHYVVPVAWTDDAVLLHDPARGPFLVRDVDSLIDSWEAAGKWMLLILPSHSAAPEPAATTAARSALPTTPCEVLIARAVTLTRLGRHAEADALLQEAARRCPDTGIAYRERASLRFLDADWAAAATMAERAVTEAPTDAHAWRLLGASRFMLDDRTDALRAWNRADEPRLDRVVLDMHGATNAMLARERVGLTPGALVTPGSLRHAYRRLSGLPTVSDVRVGYVPLGMGLANVDVVVREKQDALGKGSLLRSGVRALVSHELHLEQPLHGTGASAGLLWRWQRSRPVIAVGIDLPRAFGMTGLWRVGAAWGRQAYATGQSIIHRRVSLRYASWVGPDTHLEAGVSLDRWAAGLHATLAGVVDRRLDGDRLSIRLSARVSPALRAARPFARAGAAIAWRSSPNRTPAFAARAGLDTATRGAPLDAWPRAGLANEAPVLMRAHPLLDGGVAGGPLLGRRLAHASGEVRLPIQSAAPVGLALVLFADAGRAWNGSASGVTARTQLDLGTAIELHVPGVNQALRIDLARGLRDGAQVVSVAWQPPWPGGR